MSLPGSKLADLQALLDENLPGARLVDAKHLEGGVAAEVLRVTFERGGKASHFTLRSHGAHDLALTPDLPQIEFDVLTALRTTSIPAPEPFFVDTSRRYWEGPVLAISFIEGALDLNPANLDIAMQAYGQMLARINACKAADVDLGMLRHQKDLHLALMPLYRKKLAAYERGAEVSAVLESHWPREGRN